jgi:hypothetical protein
VPHKQKKIMTMLKTQDFMPNLVTSTAGCFREIDATTESGAPDILSSIACILVQIRNSNEEKITNLSLKAPFVGEDIPDLAVPEYCERLAKYFRFSPTLYVAALIYIDKYVRANPEVVINRFTVHRLLIVSFTLAAKYWEDLHYSNTYYAQVGGIDLKELNDLELQMLSAMRFDLHIPDDVFRQYRDELRMHPSVCNLCGGAELFYEPIMKEETLSPKKYPSEASHRSQVEKNIDSKQQGMMMTDDDVTQPSDFVLMTDDSLSPKKHHHHNHHHIKEFQSFDASFQNSVLTQCLAGA